MFLGMRGKKTSESTSLNIIIMLSNTADRKSLRKEVKILTFVVFLRDFLRLGQKGKSPDYCKILTNREQCSSFFVSRYRKPDSIHLVQWFLTFYIQLPTLQSDITKLPTLQSDITKKGGRNFRRPIYRPKSSEDQKKRSSRPQMSKFPPKFSAQKKTRS